MQNFTAFEYVLIDIANQYGLDKELFENRIDWALNHMDSLEELMSEADEPYRYIKAVRVLRDIQAGKPIGHRMGMDACSSGVQIMSAIMGCEVGANSTGLVDPSRRADLYKDTTNCMNALLQGKVTVDRGDIKQAQMTHYYGSKATPREIFGEDTPELEAFYEANNKMAPGANILMDVLLDSWNRDALEHAWTLPDGFYAKVKVTHQVEKKIEVDELNHGTFTHTFHEHMSTNQFQVMTGEYQPDGLSIAANVVHSKPY